MQKLSFELQTKATDGTVLVIDEFLKFQYTEVPFETRLAFSHGYWNVFKHTQELQEFLAVKQIAYSIKDRGRL